MLLLSWSDIYVFLPLCGFEPFFRFCVNRAGLYYKNHALPFISLNLYVDFIYFSILTEFK